MAKQNINVGTKANDKAGDPLRTAFTKINDNFTELYTLTGGTSTALTELAQDYAAPLFTHASHTNITVTYDDANNKILLTGAAAQVQSNWTASSGLGVILNKPTLFSGSYTDLTNKPTIPSAYTLPTASASILGGIKIGSGLSIDGSGVVTAGAGSTLVNSTQTVSLSSSGVLTLPNNGKIASGVSTTQVGSTTTIALNDQGTNQAYDVNWAGIAWTGNEDVFTTYAAGSSITFANGDVRTITDIQKNAVYGFPGQFSIDIYWSASRANLTAFPITLKTSNYAAAYTAPEWQFGTNGALTFPDASVQTKAYTGIPGPYANDAAAATANVAVGYPYHKTGTGGQVFVRLT